ncbi:MAG: hypothetical protein OK439_06835 [Thaumarchaeota archaeon]|nr:hypothetical protein [Nitrososphaerota archaeon]
MARDESFALTQKDQEFIKELGLAEINSLLSMEKEVAKLNMRQLDKLKQMFRRVSKEGDYFSKPVETGIANNDLGCFAEAIIVLKSKA